MKTKHAIVIDNQGYKTELILVDFIEVEGEINEMPVSYVLKDGESLIYENISTALSMIKPRWNPNTKEWEETGTLEITKEMIEILRAQKLQDVNTACQQAIHAGVEVETSIGIKNFRLTEHDQTEILALTAHIATT